VECGRQPKFCRRGFPEMRAIALVVLATFALAACDAPDPSEFHHQLRSDAMTGTHLTGDVGSGELGTVDQTGVEQIQRQGNINMINGK
jgi:hypothetical protein